MIVLKSFKLVSLDENMKYCEKCGSKLVENAKFCEQCGTRVPEVSEKKVDNKNKKKNLIRAVTFLGLAIVTIAVLVIQVGLLAATKSTE